jgi:hypothetical protein
MKEDKLKFKRKAKATGKSFSIHAAKMKSQPI